MGFGGNGSTGSIGGSTDVALSNPANGQILTYDTSVAKWKNTAAPAAAVSSVAGRTGAIVLGQSDITGLTTSLAGLAPLASPSFTGTVHRTDPDKRDRRCQQGLRRHDAGLGYHCRCHDERKR